jgi:hypothetical protein
MEVVLLVYRLIMSAAVVLFMPDTLAQVMCTSCASARIELSNHCLCEDVLQCSWEPGTESVTSLFCCCGILSPA